MRYRQLGRTGLAVSEIGFGGFAIGGHDYGPTDDRESLEALEAAYDLGVTFFDTADMYGNGRSEELIGTALRGKEAVVATKVGYVGARGHERGQPKDFSRRHIFQSAERSLRRLKRDAIDLYQLHNPTVAELESGEAFDAMEELVLQGKARFWGVSAPSRSVPEIARRAFERPTATSLQLIWNLFHRRDAEALRPELRARGAAVIARAPLEYGLLTGKFSVTTGFAPGDHRNWRWPQDEFAGRLETVDALRVAFSAGPFTLGQLAIAFVLSQPEGSVVLCGAKRRSQVEENVAASDLLGGVIREADLARAAAIVAE